MEELAHTFEVNEEEMCGGIVLWNDVSNTKGN